MKRKVSKTMNTPRNRLPARIATESAPTAVVLLLAAACGATAPSDDGDDFGEPPRLEQQVLGTSTQALQNAPVMTNGVALAGVVLVEQYDFTLQRWRSCTGQITSKNTLLTGGHCFARDQTLPTVQSGNWYVRITRYLGNDEWERLHSSSYIDASVKFHSDFFREATSPYFDFTHDMAIVTAPSDWQNVASHDAAAIIKQSWAPLDAWMTGYGLTSMDATADRKMRAAEIRFSYDASREEYTAPFGQNTAKLCPGDSGGPLKTQFFSSSVVHGTAISSPGGSGSNCGTTGYWAPTFKNWEFIRDAIGTCNDGSTWLTCW